LAELISGRRPALDFAFYGDAGLTHRPRMAAA
jgi:hypothetical protein